MTELELRSYCGAGAGAGLPARAEAANGLLLEMLHAQLHPAVAQRLLAKASPAQLVLHGNILGPRHHAAELLRTRVGGQPRAERQPPSAAEQAAAEACCSCGKQEQEDADLQEAQSCSYTSSSGGGGKVAFPEPDKFNSAAALQTGGAGWVLAPLAICSWGAMLAAVILVKWA